MNVHKNAKLRPCSRAEIVRRVGTGKGVVEIMHDDARFDEHPSVMNMHRHHALRIEGAVGRRVQRSGVAVEHPRKIVDALLLGGETRLETAGRRWENSRVRVFSFLM
ncbi:MAG: hypothetical protein OXM58_04340 [Rhodospirillaceae bacterium]|nr:hypothetical protein [Rhodospirillaceae bacterium]MDE0617636.1 hypothetical protein [Rhodospirillaceae bacterium]